VRVRICDGCANTAEGSNYKNSEWHGQKIYSWLIEGDEVLLPVCVKVLANVESLGPIVITMTESIENIDTARRRRCGTWNESFINSEISTCEYGLDILRASLYARSSKVTKEMGCEPKTYPIFGYGGSGN